MIMMIMVKINLYIYTYKYNKKKYIIFLGCCISCGEIFCRAQNMCVEDWDTCQLGVAYTSPDQCSFYYNASGSSSLLTPS